MSNIVNEVWKFIQNNPSIRRNMNRGLINTSALARYIIQEKKINATIDAVIGAIRRYELKQTDDIFENASRLFDHTINISTKNNLAEVSLIKDTEVQKFLPELFNIINYVRGDVLRIMQANDSVTLLFDDKNLKNVLALFPKNKIINTEKNLSEINIRIHPKMQTTPGILAVIANELAINGINIVELMTCPPELLCVIKKEDLIKSNSILFKLCESTEKK